MLKDIFTGKTRKTMNLVFSGGVAALGIWAAFTAAMPGWELPAIYGGLMAGWLAFGGYLGLQSSSNITTEPQPTPLSTLDGAIAVAHALGIKVSTAMTVQEVADLIAAHFAGGE